MKSAIQWVNRHLAGFTGWLMLGMMLLLIADVIGRAIGLPFQGIAELSVFVMMIVIYLGFSRCEERNEHVSLEFAVNMLPRRGKTIMLAIGQALAVLTIGFLLYAVVMDALDSYATNSSIEGTFEIPYWPTKFIMVLGMVFFVLQGIVNLASAIRRISHPDDASDEKAEATDYIHH